MGNSIRGWFPEKLEPVPELRPLPDSTRFALNLAFDKLFEHAGNGEAVSGPSSTPR